MKIHDEYIMPFGRYKGKMMTDLPGPYIIHMAEKFQVKDERFRTSFEKAFIAYSEDNRDAFALEAKKEKRIKKTYTGR